jgi:hypothetical protein
VIATTDADFGALPAVLADMFHAERIEDLLPNADAREELFLRLVEWALEVKHGETLTNADKGRLRDRLVTSFRHFVTKTNGYCLKGLDSAYRAVHDRITHYESLSREDVVEMIELYVAHY